ncbi:MAG TPA: hypothetical protein VFX89_06385 [Gammaproteobacteria bacterium]|nr:hypothetical protein [Gammaproteobacteria bacterium]
MIRTRTFSARRPIIAAALLSLCASAGAQPSFRNDPNLIDKLHDGDFAHIADDNFGRMDLEAVLMAFRTDEELPRKCDIMGGTGLDGAGLVKFLGWIKYLNTDSATGTFPSAQFLALSVLGAGTLGIWALDPNMLAMAEEIDADGCSGPRVKKIRENFARLMDQRIEWHSKDQSPNIGVSEARGVKITLAAYRSAVSKDVALPAQEAVLRQIAGLESSGAALLECEYGPLNPDSTGFETATFWYQNTPLTMNDLQKASRQHPLGGIGDDAVTDCPRSLADARRAVSSSRQHGIAKLDLTALAPDGIDLDQYLGAELDVYRRARSSWVAYQTSRDPRDENQAMIGKAEVLTAFRKGCDSLKQYPTVKYPPPTNCDVLRQLEYELAAIPDPPSSGLVLMTDALPNGLTIYVSTLEPIDLHSQDETRTYKAELSQPSVWQGLTVLPQGTPVTLRLVRTPPEQWPPNVMIVKLSPETVLFNGKETAIRTLAEPIQTAADPKRSRPLPSKTTLAYSIQGTN